MPQADDKNPTSQNTEKPSTGMPQADIYVLMYFSVHFPCGIYELWLKCNCFYDSKKKKFYFVLKINSF